MLNILQKKGYTVIIRDFILIRKELHIYRYSFENAPQQIIDELMELVKRKFTKNSVLNYGRVNLTTYFYQ
jgi:hypothetical protein